MSTKGVFRVECPLCGESFDADFWTVVRGDRDEKVKELIFSGEFDILMCPKCGGLFQHEESFLYLDPGKDLLAFVMPESYAPEKDKWIAKMRADYEPVRAPLAANHKLSGEPLWFFGLGPLAELLEGDRDREEETEVVEFMAREAGLELLAVKPAVARELDLPFSLPVPKGLRNRAAALKAARELLAKNDALSRLKNLEAALLAAKDDAVPFVKADEAASS
ncbi:MAG TPA: CpXC domain-containing protein [Elusimicrobiales bacterium]|nr:CpXC domain-containing protein [Elusimicrobiales bacterium]